MQVQKATDTRELVIEKADFCLIFDANAKRISVFRNEERERERVSKRNKNIALKNVNQTLQFEIMLKTKVLAVFFRRSYRVCLLFGVLEQKQLKNTKSQFSSHSASSDNDMLQNGPNVCYHRMFMLQHTHYKRWNIPCRLCACYQIIAISAFSITIQMEEWTEEKHWLRFYGKWLFFKPDTYEIFGPRHTHSKQTNKRTSKKLPSTQMFLSKNPKTISIRKLPTSPPFSIIITFSSSRSLHLFLFLSLSSSCASFLEIPTFVYKIYIVNALWMLNAKVRFENRF